MLMKYHELWPEKVCAGIGHKTVVGHYCTRAPRYLAGQDGLGIRYNLG